MQPVRAPPDRQADAKRPAYTVLVDHDKKKVIWCDLAPMCDVVGCRSSCNTPMLQAQPAKSRAPGTWCALLALA